MIPSAQQLRIRVSVILLIAVALQIEAAPGIALFAVPVPTGDPEIDYVIRVRPGDDFVLYGIVSSLEESIAGWEMGLRIRDAATVVLKDLRTSGDSLFDQNSIGTIGFARSTLVPCLEIDGILVEFVCELANPVETEIQLIGPAYGMPDDEPLYIGCDGVSVKMGGDRTAIQILPDTGVPTAVSSWSTLKSLFEL